MDWKQRVRRIGLILFSLSVAVYGLQTFEAATDGCDIVMLAVGCPNVGGSIEGDSAVLDGELTVGGSPGGSGGSGGGSQSGVPGSGSGAAPPPMPCEEVFAGLCYGVGQDKPGEESGAEGIPAVTIDDVAAFRPNAPRQSMQPDGWMIVGLPTNFIAHTQAHIVSGTLLGAPADVLFTPIGYRWRYGDGTTVRLATAGAHWQSQGLREFDATPTSHIYRQPGTYVIELDVEFTAAYRFASGSWQPLAGIIVVPANDLVATAGDAVTVLVDRDCATAPRGLGC